MAAMKPRTGDGPLEVTKEGRGIVMRVPLEGGGRRVVEMSAREAGELGAALKAVAGWAWNARSHGGPGHRPGLSVCPAPASVARVTPAPPASAVPELPTT